MEFRETRIKGCFEIKADMYRDHRGVFVKTFQEVVCAEHGIHMKLSEQYFSVSKKGVLRGLHFQVPPFAQNKLVTIISGRVFDVVVDLRRGSPTYGEFETFELDADKGGVLYIPQGLAHGFQALTDDAILGYQVSSIYSPEHDRGVRWNSAGIPWPMEPTIMADRDNKFVGVKEYESPFLA